MNRSIKTLITIAFLPIVAIAQSSPECAKLEDLARNFYNSQKYDSSGVYYLKKFKCSKLGSDLYNAACSFSLNKDSKRAFDCLKESIYNGCWDKNYIYEDQDLFYLRNDINNWNNVEKWLLDAKKELLLELSKLKNHQELIPFCQNGKWGYMTKKKKPIVSPMFNRLSFSLAEYGEMLCLLDYINPQNSIFQFNSGFLGCPGDGHRCTNFYRSDWMQRFDSTFQHTPSIAGLECIDYLFIKNERLYKVKRNDISNPAQKNDLLLREGIIQSNGKLLEPLNLSSRYITFINYGKDRDHCSKEDTNGDFGLYGQDSTGAWFLLDSKLEYIKIKDVTEIKQPCFYVNHKGYKYLSIKVGSKYGIFNIAEKRWTIKPILEDLIEIEGTYKGKWQENVLPDTEDIYFKVKKDGREFYIDENGEQYLLNE